MYPILRFTLVAVVLSACGDVAGNPDAGGGFALSVTTSGDGAGTVTSSPSGITCGADCTETFAAGTMVTLTATPTGNSTFAGWSGACTGIGGCTATIDGATEVTAMFTNQRSLTVTLAGTGSVTSNPAGISCGTTCVASFAPGTTVVLNAAMTDALIGWSGACSGFRACGVTITGSDAAVTATFGQRLGHTTQFPAPSNASANYLLGEKLDVTTTTTLVRFGALMAGASGNAKMALYTDAGGKPGTLVAQTASTTITPGFFEMVPTVSNISLPAGSYWILATYDVSGPVYYSTTAGANVINYTALPYASAMPNPFPTPSSYPGQSFNYYLVVR